MREEESWKQQLETKETLERNREARGRGREREREFELEFSGSSRIGKSVKCCHVKVSVVVVVGAAN